MFCIYKDPSCKVGDYSHLQLSSSATWLAVMIAVLWCGNAYNVAQPELYQTISVFCIVCINTLAKSVKGIFFSCQHVCEYPVPGFKTYTIRFPSIFVWVFFFSCSFPPQSKEIQVEVCWKLPFKLKLPLAETPSMCVCVRDWTCC